MSRSLLHDWECAIDKCCREDNPTEMISIAEDIYNTAYARGKNQSIDVGEVLDKIRAEIIELRSKQNVGVLECLDIIDKYKAETEET